MSLAIIFIYLALVLTLGVLSHKLFRNTGEDYFVASRTINWFILLMSLFGTNMTAFSILGASGEAYHRGIGVFALMASSSALVVPCVFLFIGTRLWKLGKQFGYMTQVQYFRDRWEAGSLGLLIFIVLVLLLIPYLLIGVMGGGGYTGHNNGWQNPTVVRRVANLCRCPQLCHLRRYAGDRLGEHIPNACFHGTGRVSPFLSS